MPFRYFDMLIFFMYLPTFYVSSEESSSNDTGNLSVRAISHKTRNTK